MQSFSDCLWREFLILLILWPPVPCFHLLSTVLFDSSDTSNTTLVMLLLWFYLLGSFILYIYKVPSSISNFLSLDASLTCMIFVLHILLHILHSIQCECSSLHALRPIHLYLIFEKSCLTNWFFNLQKSIVLVISKFLQNFLNFGNKIPFLHMYIPPYFFQ